MCSTDRATEIVSVSSASMQPLVSSTSVSVIDTVSTAVCPSTTSGVVSEEVGGRFIVVVRDGQCVGDAATCVGTIADGHGDDMTLLPSASGGIVVRSFCEGQNELWISCDACELRSSAPVGACVGVGCVEISICYGNGINSLIVLLDVLCG